MSCIQLAKYPSASIRLMWMQRSRPRKQTSTVNSQWLALSHAMSLCLQLGTVGCRANSAVSTRHTASHNASTATQWVTQQRIIHGQPTVLNAVSHCIVAVVKNITPAGSNRTYLHRLPVDAASSRGQLSTVGGSWWWQIWFNSGYINTVASNGW